MKKKFAVMLALSMTMGALAGCAGTPVVYYTECDCEQTIHNTNDAVADDSAEVEAEKAETENVETEEVVLAEGALKTGLAIVTSVAKSENAKAADYDVTQVAVLVDDNGVIRDCIIDGIATKVAFDEAGVISTDLTAEVSTKNELGENYGMVAWGGAKFEWDVQAEALAQYAIDKTVEELKNGSINESGMAAEGTDLASTATIYLGGYVSAIEAAVANAKHLGAQAGDELRLASLNSVGSSQNATAEKAGVAQLDSDVTALTVKDGMITSCYLDSVQAKVNFDQTGAISTDLSAPVLTKNELGENYGMVAWGGAIAEWDAQAAKFAEYVTGKTAADVAGIAVTETTAPAEADLTSTVTIAIGGFQALIDKAMN